MPCRTERPARISSLTRSKMTMFASAATPIVRIRPAMPGQRHRDRDQLDQRVEVDAVDDQAADGDQAEQAVVGQQQQDHDDETDERRRPGPDAAPAGRASPKPGSQRSGPSLTGSAPSRSWVASASAVLDGEATGDLTAAARRDPIRELGVVDRGNADQLVIKRDREVLQVVLVADAQLRAADCDLPGDILEELAAVALEAEGHVRLRRSDRCSPAGLLIWLPNSAALSLIT